MTMPSDEQPSWVHCDTPDEIEKFYISVMPQIRKAARECGYGIGVHGSMRRDLDLIAVPWVDDPWDKDTLAAQIQKAACGFTQAAYQWEAKPHGRIATAFPICWTLANTPNNGHIDLSIMPSIAAAVEAERQRWVGVCDYYATTEDASNFPTVNFIAREIKRRGLE